MNGWKWLGLGALAAVAVAGTTAVVIRSRRHWTDGDDAEVSRRLHERLTVLRSAAG